MVIRDDEVAGGTPAGLTPPRFRQKSNPAESEVHVMNAEPSGMHPTTEDTNDERREAR
jgi:hypothetical protein